jgi:hypothetical protein
MCIFFLFPDKMPYVYIGEPSVYYGKRLFKLLCQVKHYGQGRIVYRSTEQNHPEPTFYRILLAQPEKDDKLNLGRIVAERIFRGRRRKELAILSEEAQFPDFKLVPKDKEATFCRWDQVKDFVHERDAELKPKWMEMPPLLKKIVIRNRQAHGETCNEDDLKLPAYKIYEDEHRLEDRLEPHTMAQFLNKKYATHKDFDLDLIPFKDWNLSRLRARVGYRHWLKTVEDSPDWPELQRRMSEEKQSADSN